MIAFEIILVFLLFKIDLVFFSSQEKNFEFIISEYFNISAKPAIICLEAMF